MLKQIAINNCRNIIKRITRWKNDNHYKQRIVQDHIIKETLTKCSRFRQEEVWHKKVPINDQTNKQ